MITEQQYLFSVGVRGTEALHGLRGAITNLDSKFLSFKQREMALAAASQQTLYAFNELDKTISSKLVKNTMVADEKTKELTTSQLRFTDIVRRSTGELIKYNYVLEKARGVKGYSIAKNIATEAHPVSGLELQNLQNQLAPKSLLTKTLGEGIDIGGLVSRAMVTIPVWYAMRQAMSATFGIIPEGIQRFKDLDTAIADMASQTDKIGNFETFSGRMKDAVNNLSKETGQSISDISKAYIEFATTGMTVEDSQAGMTVAVKGSIATMAEQKELASILATLYNNFGSSLDQSWSATEKFQYLMGTLNQKFKENAGTLHQYIESIKSFAGVAKGWNVTYQQMITLVTVMHNLAQTGGTVGTQLSRAFQEITKNSSAVESFLGKSISGANKFEVFQEVLTKLNHIQKEGDISGDVMEMFGERSQKAVLALVNDSGFKRLEEQLRKINAFTLGDAIKLNEQEFTRRMATVNRQLDITKALVQDLGMNFLSGLFNIKTNDPVTILKKVNEELKKWGDNVKGISSAMNEMINNPFTKLVLGLIALRMGLSVAKNVGKFAINTVGSVGTFAGQTVQGFKTAASIPSKANLLQSNIATNSAFLAEDMAQRIGISASKFGTKTEGLFVKLGQNLDVLAFSLPLFFTPISNKLRTLANFFIGQTTGGAFGSVGQAVRGVGAKATALGATAGVEAGALAGALGTSKIASLTAPVVATIVSFVIPIALAYLGASVIGTLLNGAIQPARRKVAEDIGERGGTIEDVLQANKPGWLEGTLFKSFGINDLSQEDVDAFMVGNQKKMLEIVKRSERLATKKSQDFKAANDGLDEEQVATLSLQERLINARQLKQYGLDEISMAKALYAVAKKGGEDSVKLKERELAILELQIAEQNRYTDNIQKTLETSLQKNLRGENVDIIADIQIANREQLRKSVSELVSSSIMSTGIGEMFAQQFGFIDEARRKITEPIESAHSNGGKTAAGFLDKMFDKWFGVGGKAGSNKEGTKLLTAEKISGSDPTGLLSHAAITNQKAEAEKTKSWTPPKDRTDSSFSPSPFTYRESDSGFATGGFAGATPTSYDPSSKINYSGYYDRVNKLAKGRFANQYGPSAVTLDPIVIRRSRSSIQREDMSDFFPLTGGYDESSSSPWLTQNPDASQTFSAYNLKQTTGTSKVSESSFGRAARYTGMRPKLPGIWEAMNKGSMFGMRTGQTLTSPGGFKASGIDLSNKKPSWGQVGFLATSLGSSVITASDGVNQIKGGGAKNITQGVGTVAGSVGMASMGMLSAGMFGGAAGAGIAGSTASMLGVLGVVGIAIMAVLMIASLFMKGPKQTSTQVQTSETKVGSKIDISNKKLELINRNLIALRNTMETYALATSSYYSEKNYANIDSEFALSTRRSY